MLEDIVIVGVVAVAAGMTGRSFYRAVRGKNGGCGCAGNRQTCELSGAVPQGAKNDAGKEIAKRLSAGDSSVTGALRSSADHRLTNCPCGRGEATEGRGFDYRRRNCFGESRK